MPNNQTKILMETKSTPIQSEVLKILPNVKLMTEFDEFVRFCATPRALRAVKTQEQFANKFGVSPDTLSDWKKLPEFFEAVRREIRSREKGELSEIVDALRGKALNGDAGAIRLWLQYVGEVPTKGQKKD
jgi:hypothetical protein